MLISGGALESSFEKHVEPGSTTTVRSLSPLRQQSTGTPPLLSLRQRATGTPFEIDMLVYPHPMLPFPCPWNLSLVASSHLHVLHTYLTHACSTPAPIRVLHTLSTWPSLISLRSPPNPHPSLSQTYVLTLTLPLEGILNSGGVVFVLKAQDAQNTKCVEVVGSVWGMAMTGERWGRGLREAGGREAGRREEGGRGQSVFVVHLLYGRLCVDGD